MEGELDPLDFELALSLGMTLETMWSTMSNPEYHMWRAFRTWRTVQQELK